MSGIKFGGIIGGHAGESGKCVICNCCSIGDMTELNDNQTTQHQTTQQLHKPPTNQRVSPVTEEQDKLPQAMHLWLKVLR